ncbi:alpha/beta hydrolase [Oceanobacillus sp. E9]|uniref:Alpha/beta hydrolase n=1 Tax=Oceanobacillus kimchii TaxID=746691 RepID=A0ABQ5TGD9_9BACI|nr:MULTISPECIES: alpha/beta hydrolase [Oceanobacillus]OEH54223.1 alpha/beta hydrolase [Oceanobacillus sp. E9]GLO65525.1 alpha/beta hydrolase [Oceanobacillus kimchii]
MKRKKKWIWIVSSIAILLIIINFAAAYFFYQLAIERNVKDFLSGNQDLEVSAETLDVLLDGDWRNWSDEQNYENWNITSHDGLNLEGYFLRSKEPSNKVVIMAHGYLGKGKDMALYGEHYVEQLGYHMLTPDLRGHGQSDGDYIGFGWHDRLDMMDWIDKVIERFGDDVEIVLQGVSMGASTMLMTSGEELPSNVKAIVADCPYTSVADLFDYQIDRMYNLPSFPFIPSTSLITQMFAGYSFNEASALDQVQTTDIPIFYVHGKEDQFVPTEMTETLYEKTSSPKELLLVDSAGHGEAFVTKENLYIEKLNSFLNKYVDE